MTGCVSEDAKMPTRNPARHEARSRGARAGPAPTRHTCGRLLLALAPIAFASMAFGVPQDRPPQEETEAEPSDPARDDAPEMPRDFADLDLNGDGQLTREEAAADATLTLRFGEADLDDDGLLTRTELGSIDDEPPQP